MRARYTRFKAKKTIAFQSHMFHSSFLIVNRTLRHSKDGHSVLIIDSNNNQPILILAVVIILIKDTAILFSKYKQNVGLEIAADSTHIDYVDNLLVAFVIVVAIVPVRGIVGSIEDDHHLLDTADVLDPIHLYLL